MPESLSRPMNMRVIICHLNTISNSSLERVSNRETFAQNNPYNLSREDPTVKTKLYVRRHLHHSFYKYISPLIHLKSICRLLCGQPCWAVGYFILRLHSSLRGRPSSLEKQKADSAEAGPPRSSRLQREALGRSTGRLIPWGVSCG